MPEWLERVKGLFGARTPPPTDPSAAGGEQPVVTTAPGYGPQPAPPPTPQKWHEYLYAAVPAMLLAAGAGLALLTQVIGPWAFLGYLLVAVSPVVWMLQRVEKKINELIEATRGRRR